MNLLESLGKLNIECQEADLSSEITQTRIQTLIEPFVSKMQTKFKDGDHKQVALVFRMLCKQLSMLVDSFFLKDAPKDRVSFLFVLHPINVALRKAPLFLRKDKMLGIYENLVMLAAKVFHLINGRLLDSLEEGQSS